MGAGCRQERLLNAKRLFEQQVALRSEAAVAGKFRGRDGSADVIKFISRREWTIERNADHDGFKGLDVEYLGLDINADYIAFARRTYGDKGTFVVGDTRSLRGDTRFRDADIVLAISVLHHLNDEEAAECIRFAYDALKRGGRLICHDACWIPNQGAVSKWIMSYDRGRNIRTEQQCRQLAGKIFRNVHARVDTKPLRIPYVTIVLECEK